MLIESYSVQTRNWASASSFVVLQYFTMFPAPVCAYKGKQLRWSRSQGAPHSRFVHRGNGHPPEKPAVYFVVLGGEGGGRYVGTKSQGIAKDVRTMQDQAILAMQVCT